MLATPCHLAASWLPTSFRCVRDTALSSLLDDLRLQKEKQHRWETLRQVRNRLRKARGPSVRSKIPECAAASTLAAITKMYRHRGAALSYACRFYSYSFGVG